jgi:hypothetical protein
VDELLQQIRDLANDRAMEAARLLASEDVSPARTKTIIDRIAAQVPDLGAEAVQHALDQASPDEIAALSRALLTYAALDGREANVRLAIEGAGKRLLVLEAVAVGALALAAYQLWKTGGKQKLTSTIEITVKPDGVLTIRKDVIEENYGIGEILGSAVKAALGGGQ